MRRLQISGEDYVEVLRYGNDEYELSFPMGADNVVFVRLKKNETTIFQTLLNISKDITTPWVLPFKIVIIGDKGAKKSIENIILRIIEVYIYD